MEEEITVTQNSRNKSVTPTCKGSFHLQRARGCPTQEYYMNCFQEKGFTDVRGSYILLLMHHHIFYKVQIQLKVSVCEYNIGSCIQKNRAVVIRHQKTPKTLFCEFIYLENRSVSPILYHQYIHAYLPFLELLNCYWLQQKNFQVRGHARQDFPSRFIVSL